MDMPGGVGEALKRKRTEAKDQSMAMGQPGRSVFDALGAQPGTIAELLEKQSRNTLNNPEYNNKALGEWGTQNVDPMQQLIQDLYGRANSINVPSTPYEELQRMAEQQVSAQFDPMIQMLKEQMGQKQQRAGRSQGEARQMYGDLATDFLNQLPQMTNQFAQEDAQTNARYDNAQQELQRLYGAQSQEQNDVLNRLGIQAAAPDASKQAREDQAFFQANLGADQQSAMNALNAQQGAAEGYQRDLGNTTRVAGENVAQDIGRQLEDYLAEAGTQMGGLQGQRGQTLAALLAQMQGQDQSRVQQQAQQQFENMMNMSKFQLDAQKAQNEMEIAGLKAGGKGYESGLPGAESYLGKQYAGSPVKMSGVLQQLQDVLRNPEVEKGKFILEPAPADKSRGPVYSDIGQEYMMKLLRQEFEKENQASPGRYSDADITNAISALQAYLGKVH